MRSKETGRVAKLLRREGVRNTGRGIRKTGGGQKTGGVVLNTGRLRIVEYSRFEYPLDGSIAKVACLVIWGSRPSALRRHTGVLQRPAQLVQINQISSGYSLAKRDEKGIETY